MEMQLQELIDQIKKNGVEEAETQAAAILEAARAEADKTVAEARAEADRIMEQARQENERTVKASEEAIRQAGRNLLLTFRESVARELKSVVGEQVAAAFSTEELTALILKAVENWTKNPDAADVTVILSTADLQRLEESLLAGLKARLMSGVTLQANDNLTGGFRIAVDNGRVYYDYAADAVVELLAGYLSPRVTALLKEAESHG